MCILLVTIKRNNKHKYKPDSFIHESTCLTYRDTCILYTQLKKIRFFSNETIQFLCGFSADCPSSEELQTNVYAARLHANCARESESQRFRSDWLVFFFFLFEKKKCVYRIELRHSVNWCQLKGLKRWQNDRALSFSHNLLVVTLQLKWRSFILWYIPGLDHKTATTGTAIVIKAFFAFSGDYWEQWYTEFQLQCWLFCVLGRKLEWEGHHQSEEVGTFIVVISYEYSEKVIHV